VQRPIAAPCSAASRSSLRQGDSCGISTCCGIRQAVPPTTACAHGSAWVSAPTGNEPWSTPPPGLTPGLVSRSKAWSSGNSADGRCAGCAADRILSSPPVAGRTDLELVAIHQLPAAAGCRPQGGSSHSVAGSHRSFHCHSACAATDIFLTLYSQWIAQHRVSDHPTRMSVPPSAHVGRRLARVVVGRRPQRYRPDRVLGDVRPGGTPSTPGCACSCGWPRYGPGGGLASGEHVPERAWRGNGG
jgi:hypothetical protein